MKDTIRIGVIGGGRGRGLLETMCCMEDVVFSAVCDKRDDRLALMQQVLADNGRPAAKEFKSHTELLHSGMIDAVIIATDWTTHIAIACEAMEAGIPVGCEVAGASSMEECWKLVRTYERTKTPIMLLENCCYGRYELAAMNMADKGLFGEILHCECSYEHDLRDEVCTGLETGHYRLQNYTTKNGDVYPTHGIGPMAMLLKINRGNRFVSLTSMATKSRGLHLWAMNNLPEGHPVRDREFNLGDVVTTMIKCANGETIYLTHDTSNPRPYSRGNQVQGTKGLWQEDGNHIHIEGRSPAHTWENMDDYFAEFEHPIWKWFQTEGVSGGHGGMDFLELRAFVNALEQDLPMPIDVYDMATWMSISVLSQKSVNGGGELQHFEDFTDGNWIFPRKNTGLGMFSLDEIVE